MAFNALTLFVPNNNTSLAYGKALDFRSGSAQLIGMAANKAVLFPIVKSVVLCPEGGSEELLLLLLEFTRELVFRFIVFLEKNPPPPPPPPPENRVVKQLLEFDIFFLYFCFQSDGFVLKK